MNNPYHRDNEARCNGLTYFLVGCLMILFAAFTIGVFDALSQHHFNKIQQEQATVCRDEFGARRDCNEDDTNTRRFDVD